MTEEKNQKQEEKKEQAPSKPHGFMVGKKLNMSQYFAENGEVFPVTVVKAEPMVVTQVKTSDTKDKYSAVQVGTGKKKKNLSKSLKGHLKGLGDFAFLTEFKVENPGEFKKGKKLQLGGFKVGEIVHCIGTSKGKGFAGAMKRHGFAGFPASHGHDKPRSVGSIGQMFPQHVRKGVRMAGHMGNAQVTVKNLQIVEIDEKKNLISLKGAVPGYPNALVRIVSTGEVKPVFKAEAKKEEKKKK